ncbi:hypothetical protein [Gemmatimonas sp.]|uniref:hypothetical protein n=1 Tax=Gemmatimonas sp. TaxID=1962908 RepID=UPI00286E6D55|nr:hypothetical protein [Gemmatimonas sp.]
MIGLYSMLIAATLAARTNDYLRGTKSVQNGFFIRLLIVGCFIAPLTMGQWKPALLMVGVWLAVVRPLAGILGPRVAIWLLRMGSQGPFESWVGRPPSQLRRIYRAIEGLGGVPGQDIQTAMGNAEKKSALKSAAIDYALRRPEIHAVMQRFGADRQTLQSLFGELIACGIGGMRTGHYLPEAIAQYPRPLTFLLSWNADRSKMRQLDVAMAIIGYFDRGETLPTLEKEVAGVG